MCPACLASAALIFGSVVSGGGVAALVVKKLRWKNPAQNAPVADRAKENENGKREN
jgi:hypothetical protein